MRTTDFWKLQSSPHVKVVSVSVLQTITPRFILFTPHFYWLFMTSDRGIFSSIFVTTVLWDSLHSFVLIYSFSHAVPPVFPLHHHEKLNQTTTLLKALLTCFNSWPNFLWTSWGNVCVEQVTLPREPCVGEGKWSMCWNADAHVRNVHRSSRFTGDDFQEELCHKDSQGGS